MTAVNCEIVSQDELHTELPTSISNEKISLLSIPVNIVSLRPIFIGIAAAELIVSTDHDIRLEQHGILPSGSSVKVSSSALKLVNEFLDQLLFDILSISKSLSMSAIRLAVGEILKPKLARSALKCAEQDLEEYLNNSDRTEDSLTLPDPDLSNSDWLLELWGKTRLRCMAHSSLRDTDEIDAIYSSEEPSQMPTAISIFMVSILEFMGEQVLIVAGTAAYYRIQSTQRPDEDGGILKVCNVDEHLVVEIEDVECIALDRTLGRLWRKWRLCLDSPLTYVSNNFPTIMDLKQPVPTENQNIETLSGEITAREEYLALVENLFAYLDLAVNDSALSKLNATYRISVLPQNTRNTSQITPNESRDAVLAAQSSANNSFSKAETSQLVFETARNRAHSLPLPNRISFHKNGQRPHSFLKKEIKSSPCERDSSGVDQKGLPDKSITQLESIPDVLLKTAVQNNEEMGIESSDSMKPDINAKAITPSQLNILSSTGISSRPCDSRDDETLLDNFRPKKTCKVSADQVISDSLPEISEIFTRVDDIPLKLDSPSQSKFSVLMESASNLNTKRRPVSFNISYTKLARNSRPRFRSYPTWPILSSVQGSGLVIPLTTKRDEMNPCKQPMEGIVTKKSESILGDDKVSTSEDGNISPSAVAFAEAVQGIDAYYFDPNFVSSNSNNDKKPYPVVVHQTKLYTSSYAVEDSARSPSADGTGDNVSPVSLQAEDPILTNHCSPTSTISYMEKILEDAQGINNKQSLKSVQQTRDESTEKSCSEHEPKRAIHTSGSTSSSISHRLVVVRTSEEGAMENFDQLIESDQTIQFTLTPHNVRTETTPESRHMFTGTDNDTWPAVAKSISSPAAKSSHTNSYSSEMPFDEATSARIFTPISLPDFSMGVKLHSNVSQPRDSRARQESSSNDLAKFVRNTGPPLSISTNQSSGFQSVKNSLLLATPALHKKSPARAKLQSRGAVAQRDESISDLIDFVRSGPQLENGQHQIPLSVAPFNTTLDEDALLGSINSGIPASPLPEPRLHQTSSSINSSVTSQSALLVSSSKSKQAIIQNENRLDETSLNIKCAKQNFHDPISLEVSDNDDYEATRLDLSQEESLADFLKNTMPPDQITDLPLDKNSSKKTTAKNSHSSGLLSIFVRGSSSGQLLPKTLHKVMPQGHSFLDPDTSNSPNSNQGRSTGTFDPPKTETFRTKVQQRTYEPREPISNFRTKELAEFLMSHDPPPSENEPKPFYSTPKKGESSSLQKFFGRKKINH